MHEAVRAELNAHRQGTRAAKSRGLVSGGRSKPWRQKGTGRARQGTIRAPQFTGGGVAFPPVPRDFTLKVNRKAARAALRAALSDHASAGTLGLVAGDSFESPSTRKAAELLSGWGQELPTVVVASEDEEALIKSFRNLGRVLVTVPGELEVAHVVWARSSRSGAASSSAGARRGKRRRQSRRRRRKRAPAAPEGGALSLHPGEMLIAPVVSEKSYGQIAQNRYTFRVHQDAHKTQVRQAVEQLFDVKVVAVNIVKVQPKPKRRGLIKRHAPRLEEGHRPAEGGRLDRDLPGSPALVPIRDTSRRAPAGASCRSRPSRRSRRRSRRRACSRRSRRRGAATTTAASRRATRAAGTSAATASSTSSGRRTQFRRGWPRSSTTRTGRRASRCSTTPTAPRATSSRPRSCGSARPSSRGRPPTSASATRCRSRTSPRARSSTTSS